jgi:hypothetical protein
MMMEAESRGPTSKSTYVVTCNICGEFEITQEAWDDCTQLIRKTDGRFLLSALSKTAPMRGVSRLYVDTKLVEDVDEGRFVEPRFKEKRESLLKWYAFLSGKTPSRYGARVPLVMNRDYPAAYCRAAQDREWHFLFNQLKNKNFIKMHGEEQLEITDLGWEYLEEHPLASGVQVFIAMAFKDMTDVHAAIVAGIKAAGYEPIRIDSFDYVGGVMDEIKARIRESFFVVADLAQNRGGVYYEAGFADALDKKIIFTCEATQLNPESEERVHFDVQHLNTIPWKRDDLGELTRRLKNRIEGVFKPGPVR